MDATDSKKPDRKLEGECTARRMTPLRISHPETKTVILSLRRVMVVKKGKEERYRVSEREGGIRAY